jgi:hypothetical protein
MSALKTCVLISADLITEIGKILEDKKVQFSELVGLVPELLKLPKFVTNISAAVDELKVGVSPAYADEIKKAVSEKLDLPNDKAELIVEQCINWLVVTSSVVLQIVKVVKNNSVQ